MKSIFGLLVALAGLFIVWLWATGRASAAWQSILSGNASSGTSTGAGQSASVGVNLTPNSILSGVPSPPNVPSLVQVTPSFILPQVPSYVSLGNFQIAIPPTTFNLGGLIGNRNVTNNPPPPDLSSQTQVFA